uniref:glucuronosyltransferase n=1 Tax=Amphiprion ocellaris TaxID=80972 RepID=A0A3Q1AYC5_AMPOC
MRKAAVFVFLLLSAAMEVSGAADKKKGSEAETSKLEGKVKAKKAENTDAIPASDISSSAFKGNLLVVPMDGSHWIGVKAIAQEMGRRGHRVTVVLPEISMRMGPGKHYHTVTHPVPYDQAHIDSVMAKNTEALEKSAESFMQKVQSRMSQFQAIMDMIHVTAESLLFNDSIITHLAQQNFDAVLTDPMVPTGSLIARKLGEFIHIWIICLPTVNLLRGIPCSLDIKAAGCPSPPSYVPRFFSGLTDRMTFMERVLNSLIALFEPLLCRIIYMHFDHIAYQFLGEKVSIAEVLSDSDIWLMRIDFTLEFPRPLMPNMVQVGGINCKVKNCLPEDLESWVSGEHGFIVFTLGSMVSDLPESITAVFLEAFRQIPQKVIWRYTGKVPGKLPENVRLMKWVPQNELLAHPGARAFITHAGSHGLFEGLCHAVPMLMLPLGGDQADNAHRMASRGAGVMLDITAITTESLLKGLNAIIHDTRYKENLQKLSDLHNDRPIDPLELSVYWTEFVMRHKGAKHLKAAVHDLNFFQYYCLDVIALLVTVVLVFAMLTVKCMKVCFRRLTSKRKQD